MNTRELESALINHLVAHSGHEMGRSYIGLSAIADCPRALYLRRMHGAPAPTVSEHLRYKRGYEVEADIIKDLSALGLYRPGETISLFDGLVQGHTDGRIDGDLLEVKSVSVPEHFPEGPYVPRRVYWQVTAYLHYLKLRYAHVVYVAASNGEPRLYGVRYRAELGVEIDAKVRRLVEAVRACRQPVCECGRCEAGRIVDGPAQVQGGKREVEG